MRGVFLSLLLKDKRSRLKFYLGNHRATSTFSCRIFSSSATIGGKEESRNFVSKLNTKFQDQDQQLSTKTQQEAILATKLGAFVNFGLASGKGFIGFSTGSTALIADAANSLSDLLTDTVVYLSITEARKKATPDRPWGSGKIEPLGALFVGYLIIMTGGGICYSAICSIVEILTVQPVQHIAPMENISKMEYAGLVISAISIMSKEALFRYTLVAGEHASSASTIANAWMHRSDAMVSSGVFLGLAGAMAGYKILDPVAALLVSGIILKEGFKIGRESIEDLRDSNATEEEQEILRKCCLQTTGVLAVSELRARRSGPYLFVECIVVSPPRITASTACLIAQKVKIALLLCGNTSQHKIANAVVRVEPLGMRGGAANETILTEDARDFQTIEETVVNTLALLNKERGSDGSGVVCSPNLENGDEIAAQVSDIAGRLSSQGTSLILKDVHVYYGDSGSVQVDVTLGLVAFLSAALPHQPSPASTPVPDTDLRDLCRGMRALLGHRLPQVHVVDVRISFS